MKKNAWLAILIFILIVIIASGIAWFRGLWIHSTDLTQYLKGHGGFDSAASAVMPELSELPSYDSISYHYDKTYFGTKFEGTCLMVSYTADSYSAAKEALEEQYSFYQTDYENRYYESPASFAINDYQFRMVSIENHASFDEKYVPLIAFNDRKCCIVYLFYYDERETMWSVDLGFPYTLYGKLLE